MIGARAMLVALSSLAALAIACQGPPPAETCKDPEATAADRLPTVADAREFIARTEERLLELWIASERAAWVKATYITDDTDLIAAAAEEAVMAFVAEKAAEAQRFKHVDLEPADRRKLELLKASLDLPAPADEAKRGELSRIAASLKSRYSKTEVCEGGACKALDDLSKIMATSSDEGELLAAWKGWHDAAKPARAEYAKLVALGNEGARELGFENLGDLWKSRYDMPPADFEKEVARLWGQVKPLYDALHCYTRAKLAEKYGKDAVPAGAPIPAHLLGNMWSQEWTSLFPLVAPEKGAVDVTAALVRKNYDPKRMVEQGEKFFSSLGFDPLPKTFWERSMLARPRDRDVVCHASAWDIDWKDDLRIKMCIEVTADDFATIHHELGHNYYQRAYKEQPPLFANSANDGFHEALGDTIALSVTPKYLVDIGVLDREPPDNLNPLMYKALEKIAFLPFGYVVDQWRFDVFKGAVAEAQYNDHWWKLRRDIQGVAPPVARAADDFDPGAKYHVPANVPYTRYFLATILQFQLHRGLCKAIGFEGPLYKCSIYGNAEAGERLRKMMEMGMEKPWPEALTAVTGESRLDGSALIEYFQPLIDWLDRENAGQKCGW
jgi:peptidyl-dipeptidase A